MKIMAAARALLELLVIVAYDCEKVMTVDELKVSVLDEVHFSREERERFQQRLLTAISSGSPNELHFRKYSSPINGGEYLLPEKVEVLFQKISEIVVPCFEGQPVSTVDIDRFRSSILNSLLLPSSSGFIQFRLTDDQKNVIHQQVLEQITAPGYNHLQRLNVRNIMKASGVNSKHYLSVQQYAQKIKKKLLEGETK